MTDDTHIAPDGDNVRLLPGEGQGTLTTAAGGPLPVRTFKRGADVVLVVLDGDDADPPEDLQEAADLEYSSVRGVVRLHGRGIVEGPGLIRFEPDGEAEVTQRRSFVRVRAPLGVTLHLDEPGVHRVRTLDLSGGGMLLTGAEELGPDQMVNFSLGLRDGRPPVKGMARVVRTGETGQCALVFQQIDEGDRDRLIRFVFQTLRAARARTRGDWL